MIEGRGFDTTEATSAAPRGDGGDKQWVRQEAEHLKDELQKKGEHLFSEQKGSLASVLKGFATALERSAPNFAEAGQPNTARYTRQAAESLHRVSADLRDSDMESLKRQVVDLARQQPVLVAGGAMALGFIASRFLRSSAGHSDAEQGAGDKAPPAQDEVLVDAGTGVQAEPSFTASPVPPERETEE